MEQLPTPSAVRITADRLLLRKARDGDRDGLIELQTDPEVWTYLGNPRRRKDAEQRLDAIGGPVNATAVPGMYVIADKATDRLLGTFQLTRRTLDYPGYVTGGEPELEVGYLLRREAWGAGLAFEAASAALRAAAAELRDQPVLLVTQTANRRSLALAARLSFRRVHTFELFDAEQALCESRLHSFEA